MERQDEADRVQLVIARNPDEKIPGNDPAPPATNRPVVAPLRIPRRTSRASRDAHNFVDDGDRVPSRAASRSAKWKHRAPRDMPQLASPVPSDFDDIASETAAPPRLNTTSERCERLPYFVRQSVLAYFADFGNWKFTCQPNAAVHPHPVSAISRRLLKDYLFYRCNLGNCVVDVGADLAAYPSTQLLLIHGLCPVLEPEDAYRALKRANIKVSKSYCQCTLEQVSEGVCAHLNSKRPSAFIAIHVYTLDPALIYDVCQKYQVPFYIICHMFPNDSGALSLGEMSYTVDETDTVHASLNGHPYTHPNNRWLLQGAYNVRGRTLNSTLLQRIGDTYLFCLQSTLLPYNELSGPSDWLDVSHYGSTDLGVITDLVKSNAATANLITKLPKVIFSMGPVAIWKTQERVYRMPKTLVSELSMLISGRRRDDHNFGELLAKCRQLVTKYRMLPADREALILPATVIAFLRHVDDEITWRQYLQHALSQTVSWFSFKSRAATHAELQVFQPSTPPRWPLYVVAFILAYGAYRRLRPASLLHTCSEVATRIAQRVRDRTRGLRHYFHLRAISPIIRLLHHLRERTRAQRHGAHAYLLRAWRVLLDAPRLFTNWLYNTGIDIDDAIRHTPPASLRHAGAFTLSAVVEESAKWVFPPLGYVIPIVETLVLGDTNLTTIGARFAVHSAFTISRSRGLLAHLLFNWGVAFSSYPLLVTSMVLCVPKAKLNPAPLRVFDRLLEQYPHRSVTVVDAVVEPIPLTPFPSITTPYNFPAPDIARLTVDETKAVYDDRESVMVPTLVAPANVPIVWSSNTINEVAAVSRAVQDTEISGFLRSPPSCPAYMHDTLATCHPTVVYCYEWLANGSIDHSAYVRQAIDGLQIPSMEEVRPIFSDCQGAALFYRHPVQLAAMHFWHCRVEWDDDLVDAWLKRYPLAKREELKRATLDNDLHLPDRRVASFIKVEVMSLLTPEGLAVKAPRMINATSATYNARVGPVIWSITNAFVFQVNRDPNVHIFMDGDLRALNKKVNDFLKAGQGLSYLSCDFSKFDGSQNSATRALTITMYRKMGMPDEMAKLMWEYSTNPRASTRHGVRFSLPHKRKSGEPDTAIGNSFVTYCVVMTALRMQAPLLPPLILICSDDMLVICSTTDEQRICSSLVRVSAEFGLKLEVEPSHHVAEATFCSGTFWPVLSLDGITGPSGLSGESKDVRDDRYHMPVAFGVLPGRFIHRAGWHILGTHLISHLPGLIHGKFLSMEHLVLHVPLVSQIVARYLIQYGQAKPIQTDAGYLAHNTDPTARYEPDITRQPIWLEKRYGTSRADLEVLNRMLKDLEFPVLICHPALNTMAAVDL